MVDAIRSRALEWFGGDTAYDTRFEPSGTGFLSTHWPVSFALLADQAEETD